VAAEPFGLTPTGRFQHFVDFHALAYPMTYAAHLVSWICGGTFDRHPDFRVVFVEGGFLWYRPLLGRLSRDWPAKSVDLPAGGRTPFELAREHVRWTTQPVEEADRPREIASLMELAEADCLLMFSSDYPHFDYDHPLRALPPELGRETRRRIMSENARELYGLPGSRPRDRLDAGRAAG
jgi:predicted TIM-barrel fold metal-dependent hydrolase